MKKHKMTKRLILALGIIGLSVTGGRADSVNEKEITYADPTIYVENGKYYLTGTRNQEPQGFAILESTDLEHWTVPDGSSLQLILRKGDRTYGEKGFWAPQYFKDKRTYYFTYTANEQTVIASSKSVFGPFRQKEVKPIDASAKNIDSFLFKDDDGKYYLYHVRFNKGNYLWVAEFDIKKGSIKPETLKQCMDCTEPWEKTPNYKSAPVMGILPLLFCQSFYEYRLLGRLCYCFFPFRSVEEAPEQSDHSSQPRRRKRIRTWRCI